MARAGHSAACLRQSGFGQELFDVLVSVVALTGLHQAGKMEFHSSFDFTRRNVVTARFRRSCRSASSSGRPTTPERAGVLVMAAR
jgi:hypothetical protein